MMDKSLIDKSFFDIVAEHCNIPELFFFETQYSMGLEWQPIGIPNHRLRLFVTEMYTNHPLFAWSDEGVKTTIEIERTEFEDKNLIAIECARAIQCFVAEFPIFSFIPLVQGLYFAKNARSKEDFLKFAARIYRYVSKNRFQECDILTITGKRWDVEQELLNIRNNIQVAHQLK
jgi:hypothetical protein